MHDYDSDKGIILEIMSSSGGTCFTLQYHILIDITICLPVIILLEAPGAHMIGAHHFHNDEYNDDLCLQRCTLAIMNSPS